MQRREFLVGGAAVVSASALGAQRAFAEAAPAPVVLRVATLAPKGSAWMRVFDAWNNSLEKETAGKLKFHFYPGGAAGDERDAVRKMRAGQMDAAVITTMGLGQIVRSALVLQAPGLFDSYARIDAVRTKLAPEFEKQFDGAGFKLLGWGDAGQARVFSNQPIVAPDDLKKTRMWSWRDDPTWQAVLSAAGVEGVALGLPEVYPALRTNRINAFPGTAIAAVAFQWYTKASHVTREPNGIVIGATVIKKEKFDGLDAGLKAALVKTSETAHRALAQVIRKDDDRALEAILKRGVKAVSLAPNADKWKGLLKQARESLVGKLYPRELLKRVEDIAAHAG